MFSGAASSSRSGALGRLKGYIRPSSIRLHAAVRRCSLPRGWPTLETGPRHQQNCTDCHKENARPVRSEPQKSHATPWRLQSVANRPGGNRATKRSPPNSSARQVQDSAENEQRAKSHQEHSRLSIHRCHAQRTRIQAPGGAIRSGHLRPFQPRLCGAGASSMACSASRSAARRLIYFCLTLSGRRSGKAATRRRCT